MSHDILTPTLGESIVEATVAEWLKKPGETVHADEPLVVLETDKVTVEVPAPCAGVLVEVLAQAGANIAVGALLGRIDETAASSARPPAPPPQKAETPAHPSAPAAAAPAAAEAAILSPAARKIAAEKNITSDQISGSGPDGRILKEDVANRSSSPAAPATSVVRAAPAAPAATPPTGREERVRMSRLRQTIARRLKEAQNTAAMLTTFNEVDMSAVIALRKTYREVFEARHGVRLGFMSLFARACIAALREVPEVNAQIEGDEIVYRDDYNIGVAIGTPRGLIVPVLHHAQMMSLADIEKAIHAHAQAAGDGSLSIEALRGGTFTISNGGVYGSLLSTPILNMPQSGILGMHKIEKRAVVVDDEIVIRPMMFLALSYDHRIIDGQQAVTFLVRVKEMIEDPARLALEV